MATLPDAARAVLTSGRLAHIVTLNTDGSPQMTCIWIGVEADEIVFGSLTERQKVRNIRRDPRVVLSVETDQQDSMGLLHYLVVHGRARITEGGAPQLLQQLAYTYIGPGVRFPPMEDPPPGYVVRIRAERLGGVGPWT